MIWILLFGNALLVGLSGALMPGPLLTTVVAQSARRGMRGGLAAALGHAGLELVLVTALISGLGHVLAYPGVIRVVFVIGGVVLLGMGSETLRQGIGFWRSRTVPGTGDDQAAVTTVGPAAAGVLTTASNPYWLLWWATAGMSYLAVALTWGLIGGLMFYLGHITADLIWYGSIAWGVSRGRRLIGFRAYSGLLFGCGLFLLIFGCYFTVSGLLS